jgi:hypothetical protein
VNTSQHIDPATLITGLYCVIDDLMREQFSILKPTRPGRRPDMDDSEIITLLVLAQWHRGNSARAFLAYASNHLHSFFPRLLSPSAFNRRAHDLVGVMCALAPAIRERATAALRLPAPTHEILDGVPVPLMRNCRGQLHRTFRDEAALGRGGSDKAWYYGLKMLGAVDSHGFISGLVAGPANTEERWLAEALLRWRHDPELPAPSSEEMAPILGPTHRAGGKRKGPSGPLGPQAAVGTRIAACEITDLNYDGAAWQEHWRNGYGVLVLTEAVYRSLTEEERRPAARWLHGLRQTVETVFSRLVDTFSLKFPRARTLWGVYVRLTAKAAAHNLSVYLNHLFGQSPFSALDPLP